MDSPSTVKPLSFRYSNARPQAKSQAVGRRLEGRVKLLAIALNANADRFEGNLFTAGGDGLAGDG